MATRRRAGSTLTVAVVVPSGTASATSGRASVIRARVAGMRRRRAGRGAGRAARRRAGAAGGAGCAPRAGSPRSGRPRDRRRGRPRSRSRRRGGWRGRAAPRRSSASGPESSSTRARYGRVAADRADEGAQALAQVGRVVGLVGRARLGLEAGANRLDRIDEAVGGDHPQRIERAGGRRQPRPRGRPRGWWGCRERGPRCWPGRLAPGPAPAAAAAARWRPRGACRRRRPARRARRASAARAQHVVQLVLAMGDHGLGPRAPLLCRGHQLRPVAPGSSMPLARPLTTRTSGPALLASFRSRAMDPLLHLDRALVETAPAFENQSADRVLPAACRPGGSRVR